MPSELRELCPNCVFLEFTRDISAMAPIEFLNDIIYKNFAPKHIYCGHDYRFGSKQTGNVEILKDWASSKNISVTVFDEILHNDNTVRSGAIRELLDKGFFNKAVDLLGHDYIVHGTVVHGEGRGASLGFPTANVAVDAYKYVPPHGVYKALVYLDNIKHHAIVYVGNKPTFSAVGTHIEVHILNWTGSIYGQHLRVHLSQLIRNEIQFSKPQELIEQIQSDIAKHFHHD